MTPEQVLALLSAFANAEIVKNQLAQRIRALEADLAAARAAIARLTADGAPPLLDRDDVLLCDD